MRKDMMEVLITPGRYGSKDARNETVDWERNQRIDLSEEGIENEHLPFRESMRPKEHSDYDKKHYEKGEHLKPLKKYLESKIGQKWDDIYSEIKKANPSGTAVSEHIYEHLWGYVEKDCLEKDGKIYSMNAGYRRYWELFDKSLYIDKDGFLRQYRKEKEKTEYDICVYKVDQTTYLVKNKKGIWFIFKYSDRMREYTHTYEQEIYINKYDENNRWIGRDIVGYKTITQNYIVPYYKEIYIDSKDYTLLPVLHKTNPKTLSYWDSLDRTRKKVKQYYYLISVKQMSNKEKQHWNII